MFDNAIVHGQLDQVGRQSRAALDCWTTRPVHVLTELGPRNYEWIKFFHLRTIVRDRMVAYASSFTPSLSTRARPKSGGRNVNYETLSFGRRGILKLMSHCLLLWQATRMDLPSALPKWCVLKCAPTKWTKWPKVTSTRTQRTTTT